MNVELKSLEELIIDGQNAGPILLAVAAGKIDPTIAQARLYEWRDSLLREKAEEYTLVRDDAQGRVEAAHAEKTISLEAAAAEVDAARSQKDAAESVAADFKSRVAGLVSILASDSSAEAKLTEVTTIVENSAEELRQAAIQEEIERLQSLQNTPESPQ